MTNIRFCIWPYLAAIRGGTLLGCCEPSLHIAKLNGRYMPVPPIKSIKIELDVLKYC